jgi:hypothetical protein
VAISGRADGGVIWPIAKRKRPVLCGSELTYSDSHLNCDSIGTGREGAAVPRNWIKRDFLVGRLEQGAFDKTAGRCGTKGQSVPELVRRRA